MGAFVANKKKAKRRQATSGRERRGRPRQAVAMTILGGEFPCSSSLG
jgi:hypothetical protein